MWDSSAAQLHTVTKMLVNSTVQVGQQLAGLQQSHGIPALCTQILMSFTLFSQDMCVTGKWQEGRPRWVEQLQGERPPQQLAGSHAEALDLCLEAARMARDAGVEGAVRADQHWAAHGTMQVLLLLLLLMHTTCESRLPIMSTAMIVM